MVGFCYGCKQVILVTLIEQIWLLCMQCFPCPLNFQVHPWSWCGGLNNGHSKTVSPFHMPSDAKWVWSWMNQYGMFFIQTSTSKYRSKTCQTWEVLYIKQQTLHQNSGWKKDHSERKILSHEYEYQRTWPFQIYWKLGRTSSMVFSAAYYLELHNAISFSWWFNFLPSKFVDVL